MGRTIKHAELDERLDRLADDLEHYDERAQLLLEELDAEDARLEISDPGSYRKPTLEGVRARVSLRQQYRADVEAVELIGRRAEARLARRIEFARRRLDKALGDVGMTREELLEGPGHSHPVAFGAVSPRCSLGARVCRRWLELHAMRTELVERNLYLVLINVERYSHTTASQQDLTQEGSAALFRAVDGFDWRRGLLFRTYAVHWLNQAFRSHLYNFSNTVRVPVYLQKALKHINVAKARLGGKASVSAIAQETDLAEKLVSSAMAAVRSNRSMDAALGDDESGRLKDMLQDDVEDPYTTSIEDVSLQESLGQALGRLADRERFVLQQRFGVGVDREHTLAEVAGELGVSLERVRQIQVRALTKLRTPGLKRVVDPFLN